MVKDNNKRIIQAVALFAALALLVIFCAVSVGAIVPPFDYNQNVLYQGGKPTLEDAQMCTSILSDMYELKYFQGSPFVVCGKRSDSTSTYIYCMNWGSFTFDDSSSTYTLSNNAYMQYYSFTTEGITFRQNLSPGSYTFDSEDVICFVSDDHVVFNSSYVGGTLSSPAIVTLGNSWNDFFDKVYYYDENILEAESIAYDVGYQYGDVDGFDRGYASGYDRGEIDGFETGFSQGYSQGNAYGYENGIDDGYETGYTDGLSTGLAQGLEQGKAAGLIQGRQEGYDTGFDDGYETGYTEGRSDGFALGNTEGYQTGLNAGRQEGYDTGFDEGYDFGYDDGYDDGYETGYDDGYDDGYETGYDDGIADGESSTTVIEITENIDVGSIISALPEGAKAIIDGALGFEIFGINVAGTLTAILVVAIIGFVIKWLMTR